MAPDPSLAPLSRSMIQRSWHRFAGETLRNHDNKAGWVHSQAILPQFFLNEKRRALVGGLDPGVAGEATAT
jgi:hypothetical protein